MHTHMQPGTLRSALPSSGKSVRGHQFAATRSQSHLKEGSVGGDPGGEIHPPASCCNGVVDSEGSTHIHTFKERLWK